MDADWMAVTFPGILRMHRGDVQACFVIPGTMRERGSRLKRIGRALLLGVCGRKPGHAHLAYKGGVGTTAADRIQAQRMMNYEKTGEGRADEDGEDMAELGRGRHGVTGMETGRDGHV